ncbi:MAG TPA: hypothetical protein VGO62_11120, partial [Myxococcota bacterium]
MRALVLALSTASVAALVGACTNFDRQDQLKDLRVLGAQLSPPEIEYPVTLSTGAPPFSPVHVDVDVFAFDPRGGTVHTAVTLCAPDAAETDPCEAVGAADTAISASDPAGA